MRGLFGIFAVLVCAGASLAAPGTALADAPPTASRSADADPKNRALKHFERARELYRDGAYKEAIVELESAQALDPEAKDLVYNLALVNEKLARIDEALRWMHRYGEMDLDPAERARAEAAIRRLEGAKKTLAESKADESAPPRGAPAPTTAPANGRIDVWTGAAAGLALVGVGVGTIFGISALASRPKSGFVTGESGSYVELEDKARAAHTRAIVADVGFGVGIASGAACALLYFTRPRDAEPARGERTAPTTKRASEVDQPKNIASLANLARSIAIAPRHAGAEVVWSGALP